MLEKNPEIVVREEADGHVLLFNPQSSRSLVLNRTAYFIWQLCDGRRDRDQVEAAIAERFDFEAGGVAPERLQQAVRNHLTVLARTSLIQESGQDSEPLEAASGGAGA